MTGRKSGQQFIFSLCHGKTGNSYIVVVASKGGAPQHPGWSRNILANPEVEVQVGISVHINGRERAPWRRIAGQPELRE